MVLKKFGVYIIFDDFGMGYFVFSYLIKLLIDILKIDVSFIVKVFDEYGNSEIVMVIVILVKSFNMYVVVEGVEKIE